MTSDARFLASAVASLAMLLSACGEVKTDADPVDAAAIDGPDTDAPVTHTLIVTPAGNGTGTVTSAPAGIDCGADCSEAFASGTTVVLTATPGAGATFLGWTGAGCAGTGPCSVVVTADTAVQASFALNNSLVVTKEGNGTGLVTSAPAGIDCGADCTEAYSPGTVVTLTAAAAGESTFTGWSGSGCSGTGTCVVTLDGAAMVTATFTLDQYLLTVSRAGTGMGTVTSTPAGINCGADCTEAYDSGTAVTLTPSPAAGSGFTGWAGACTGTGACVVTMSQARSVTATFTADQYTLTVTRAGTGTGTVTSSPAGINCGADCSEAYNNGTMVTLTAAPATGSTFGGWAGSCTGTGACTVSMTQAHAVSATFTLSQHTLTVTRAGTGTGTVTSSPAGINCGADCTENYNYGTMVTLTATPATGSVFAGWSGACTGTGACTVAMTAARAVTATFTLSQHTLTVTRAGTGSGTVTSSPAGISCGADCTESYNYGTMVALTATPATGSTFSGWSGACTGTGACTVAMTAARSVTATFTLSQHTLTVTRAGTGSGTVTSSPAGISCGADCTESYNYGTSVTLTATPSAGSTFAGWAGSCTGTGVCSVSMTAARNVTATFTAGCTSSTVQLFATQSVSIDYTGTSSSGVYRDNNARAYNNPTGNCGNGSPCDITGWFHFDVTSIPNTATIQAMTLYAYATTVAMSPTVRVQYSSGNNWTRAAVAPTGLPRTSAQVGNPISPTVNVFNAFTINVASRNWATDLTDNSLTFGLDDTNLNYSYGYFAGSDVGTNRAYLNVTYCN